MPKAEEAVEIIRNAHPRNPGYLDDLLRDLIHPHATPIVPFVGAGFSVPLGFRGWRNFLLMLAAECGKSADVDQLLCKEQYEEAAGVIEGKFSPDGKWVVYCSMESGKAEIYVQPWPGPGPKIQISSEGGLDPLWRRDGKEIFYRNGSRMMAVPVSTQASFQAGKPQLLWEGEYSYGLSSSCGVKGATVTSYDVSPDGRRFLMIRDSDQNAYATRIVVVVNWVQELKRIMAEAGAKKT